MNKAEAELEDFTSEIEKGQSTGMRQKQYEMLLAECKRILRKM